MKKIIIAALIVFGIILGYNHSFPRGEWQEWQQFYSNNEKQIIQITKYKNGYFRDLDNTGSPQSRKERPNYVKCSPNLVTEFDLNNHIYNNMTEKAKRNKGYHLRWFNNNDLYTDRLL